jgi:murein DD-endopeptidase MepM/ murein hydrolase activator NlpD
VAEAAGLSFGYPTQLPGRAPGDGFFVRVAYAAENARYYPGWWHTGENWHRLGDETAGLPVFAIADGDVVFSGYDYPGLVVIVRHAVGLYSVYGHLAYDTPVATGKAVSRGDLLGAVLAR